MDPLDLKFAGGTFAEQQEQMKPINALLTSGQYRDVPGSIIQDFFSGRTTVRETIARIQGTPVFNPTSGPIIDQGFGPTPAAQAGFQLNPGTGTGFSTIQTGINQATDLLGRIQIPKTLTSADLGTAAPLPAFEPSASPFEASMLSASQNVSSLRTRLEAELQKQRDEANKRTEALFTELKSIASQADPAKDPNAAQRQRILQNELNAAEAASATIQKNFEEKQALVGELETLLSEGATLIEQMKGTTGLASIRNPRIAQAIEAVNARASVISATLAAFEDQIGSAHGIINNALNVANQERAQRIDYYNTLLELEQDRAIALDKNEKEFIGARIDLLQNDLQRSQTTADYIKRLMIDPDSALFISRAGITLNDSIEEINRKMGLQAQREEVNNMRNQLISKGYEQVPFPLNTTGLIRQDIGGQTLWFRPPAKDGDVPEISTYQAERASRTVDSANELILLAQQNPGIFGRTAALPLPDFLRSTAFRNFRAQLDTLKSNIAFNELTAMREASKTGGALGQVSDREGKLLESALGALDMSQSPENIISQLNKIKSSIERWQAAGGTTSSVGRYAPGTIVSYQGKEYIVGLDGDTLIPQ